MVTTSTGQEFNVVEEPISKAEESEDATYWDEKRMGTIRRAFSPNFRPFRSTYACLQLGNPKIFIGTNARGSFSFNLY